MVDNVNSSQVPEPRVNRTPITRSEAEQSSATPTVRSSAVAKAGDDIEKSKELQKLKDELRTKSGEVDALKTERDSFTVGTPEYKAKQDQIDTKYKEMNLIAMRGGSVALDIIGMDEDDKQKMLDTFKKAFKKFLDQGREYIEALQSAIAMAISSSGGPINISILNSNITNVAMHMIKLTEISEIDKQTDDIRLSSVESRDKSTYVAQGIAAQEKAQQARERSHADQLAEQEQPVDPDKAIKNILNLLIGASAIDSKQALEIATSQKGLLQNFLVAVNS